VLFAFKNVACADQLLDSILVTATRQPTRVSEVLADFTIITSDDIKSAGPVTTLGELLARQPGIEFRQSGGAATSSNMYIRGSNPEHVLLLIDGIRAGSATQGTPTWGFIPLEQIDRIEIIRGPSSAMYGSDAIGGVVQIFTKRGEGPITPFVDMGYGTYGTSVLSTGFSGGQ
jgi:vitamin B12 transporter